VAKVVIEVVWVDHGCESEAFIKGKTYPLRRLFRWFGFRWNPRRRVWEANPLLIDGLVDVLVRGIRLRLVRHFTVCPSLRDIMELGYTEHREVYVLEFADEKVVEAKVDEFIMRAKEGGWDAEADEARASGGDGQGLGLAAEAHGEEH